MNGRRFLPILLLLFVGSGCAALVYEVVWFQLLQLVIGVSAISLGVLLGTFMGGLFLGSLLFPRFVPAGRHPLRVYAVIELGIGAIGLLVLVVVPLVGGVYTAWAGAGHDGGGPAGGGGRHLPAPADHPDGRDAAGAVALGGIDAQGRLVARVLLRRQHGRRRARLPAGRLLPAPRLPTSHRHLRRRRPERRRRSRLVRHRDSPPRPTRRPRRRAPPRPCPARRPSTSRRRCRA